MKILTIATKPEGYFDLLKQSSEKWGYDLHALGWQKEWWGFSWKLSLYIDALKDIDPHEIIICVDGYDVVVLGPASEIIEKYKKFSHPLIFSGQRYFPNQRWIQIIADQVMSNNISTTIRKKTKDDKDYNRPCMGLLIAEAGKLLYLFEELMKIDVQKSISDDQTLLNIFYLNNPNSIILDNHCTMFQNLWRTRRGLYGKISSKDTHSEIEVYYDNTIKAKRIRNKVFMTSACLMHAPFNLDMGLLLKDLDLNPTIDKGNKSRHYWQYSIMHHVKRAFKLYCERILMALLFFGIVFLVYYLFNNA